MSETPQTCLTIEDIRAELRRLVDNAGSQGELAAQMFITPAYLSNVLSGKSEPGPAILTYLGLKKVVTYVEDRS